MKLIDAIKKSSCLVTLSVLVAGTPCFAKHRKISGDLASRRR